MKKWTVFLATTLLIVGLVLIIGAMCLIEFDFTRLDTTSYTETTHPIAGGFTSIEKIEVDTADVRFVPTTDGTFQVVCYDNEKVTYSVTMTDGALTVTATDERTWKDYVGFHFDRSLVTIYMPQGVYGSLTLEGTTGDVHVPADFTFSDISIAVSTGDITCLASAADQITIRTSTGDVDLNGVTAGSLSISTTTGDVEATNVTCSGAIAISVDTGDVELARVTCTSITSGGDTGEIELTDVRADAVIRITRSTGDVALYEVDAESLDIETSTGDVTGVLLSAKQFDADASTGDVRVPASGTGGTCKIRTSTGDIFIRVRSTEAHA